MMQREELKSHLCSLRSLWSETILKTQSNFSEEERIEILSHPLNREHPLLHILSMQILQKNSISSTVSLDKLSFAQMCQFALLNRSDFAENLLELIRFPTLWSQEESYSKEETEQSIELLLKAFDHTKQIDIFKNPYFQALSLCVSSLSFKSYVGQHLATVKSEGDLHAALVHIGKRVSLGACSFREIIIPAFGPQIGQDLFGIDKEIESERFSCLSAKKDIWLEVVEFFTHRNLYVKFYGIQPHQKVFFLLYVQADTAEINHQIFHPKTLQKYEGISESILFKRTSELKLMVHRPLKMQLIPLASSHAFWGSDFLLSVEIPVDDPKIEFIFDGYLREETSEKY